MFKQKKVKYSSTEILRTIVPFQGYPNILAAESATVRQ